MRRLRLQPALPARTTRRASTLAEVMIASLIALMVASVGGLLLLSYARLAQGVMVQEVVNGEARRALKLLEMQVRTATRLETDADTGDLVLPQPDGRRPRWSIRDGRLVVYEGAGRGRPEPGTVLMRDLAPTSRLEPVAAAGEPRLVDVRLHLIDQRGRGSDLHVLTLNTRLATRVEPPTPGESSQRIMTARSAEAAGGSATTAATSPSAPSGSTPQRGDR